MKERNSKKKMWLSLGLAGALTVGATLALFTDFTGTLTNQFNIFGGPGNKGIEISIKEHDVAETDKYLITDSTKDKWIEAKTDNDDKIKKYDNLYPNQVIDKDPTVFVTDGSASCWVVLKVTGLTGTNNVQTTNKKADGTVESDYNSYGLSNDWEDITNNLSNPVTDGTKYFAYHYSKGSSLQLPSIFKHLKVADVSGGATFTDITAEAAAAQSENSTKADSINAALDQLKVSNNYTDPSQN